MRSSLLTSALFGVSLTLASRASATVVSFNSDNIFATIPDGNPNGILYSQSITGFSGQVTDVNVTLNISGGFNGDLYGYLYHNNSISVLLNRAGRSGSSSSGYGDTGFGPDSSSSRFTLDDQASQDVHFYRTFSYSLNAAGQLTGQWQPDGRNIDPLSPGSSFPGAARSTMLSVFNGTDLSGDWRLFLADVSPGSESTLVSWGLQITFVPEPSVAALLCLSGFSCFRLIRKSKT